MLQKVRYLFGFNFFALSLFLSSLGFAESESEFRTLDWVDLMPESDYQALSNPPSYITEAEDGDDIFSDPSASASVVDVGDEFAMPSLLDDPYQQALVSRKIIPEMAGQAIRIPGFIVPLEFDDDLRVSEFFLVPYFGACIHMPPPPPNQMIYVTYPEGFQLDVLYNPFWISGVLEADITTNAMGVSAYSMKMQVIEEYSVE